MEEMGCVGKRKEREFEEKLESWPDYGVRPVSF
jgi:hypothetical protein